jgi:hypothetical protein
MRRYYTAETCRLRFNEATVVIRTTYDQVIASDPAVGNKVHRRLILGQRYPDLPHAMKWLQIELRTGASVAG